MVSFEARRDTVYSIIGFIWAVVWWLAVCYLLRWCCGGLGLGSYDLFVGCFLNVLKNTKVVMSQQRASRRSSESGKWKSYQRVTRTSDDA